MKIRLIIFDLDGTLVDSSVDITNALNHAIVPYGLDKLTVEKTVNLVGEGLTRLVEKLLGDERTDIKPAVLERFLAYYTEHLSDYTIPYPGVRETLEKLGEYRKVVISNKREALSKRLLADLRLLQYFDAVLGSDSVKERKPSPEPVLKIMSLLSINPKEAMIVGDSTYDINAGRAAGVTTVAVSYGYREVRLLQDADFIIDDIGQLVPLIEKMNKET